MKKLGAPASLLYVALCRHANQDQKAWPSYDALITNLPMSRGTLAGAVKILEQWKLIMIERGKTHTNRQMVNIYSLLDKSQWEGRVQLENSEPSSYYGKSRVQKPSSVGELKEDIGKDTKFKERENSSCNAQMCGQVEEMIQRDVEQRELLGDGIQQGM